MSQKPSVRACLGEAMIAYSPLPFPVRKNGCEAVEATLTKCGLIDDC